MGLEAQTWQGKNDRRRTMIILGKRVATRHYGIMEEWRKKLIEENIALAGYVYGKMR